MVAIQSDDYVAGGSREASLVGSTIPSNIFANDRCTESLSHIGGAVRRTVIHHDHLVDEFGHPAENSFNALLLVEARYDHSDAQALIHDYAMTELTL